MSVAAEFRRELDRLFRRRTHWLRSVPDGAPPGAPPTFSRAHVNEAIERLQFLASEALADTLARDEFEDGVSFRRSWHVKRGKGRGYDEKRRAFNAWFYEQVGVRSCIYVFWRHHDCIYVGKTGDGATRPSMHFDKAWFQPVTRIDVYATRGTRVIPALECLAIHRFRPKVNRFRAAARKWTTRCPLCDTHRSIEVEVRSLFRLR